MPTWEILIASLVHRHDKLKRLLDFLEPQVTDRVSVLIYRDNLETNIGRKRQVLLEAATADYVSFCDDDDLVMPYFVERVLEAIDTDPRRPPDYIGFEQLYVIDGKVQPRVFHSLRHGAEWRQTERGFLRGITHFNPIRRDLALLARFDTVPGEGEDHEWSVAMCDTSQVRREVYIDEPVHIKRHETRDNFHTRRQPMTQCPPLLVRSFVRYLDGAEVRGPER